MIFICGKSNSGKSLIVEELKKFGLKELPSYTDREKRRDDTASSHTFLTIEEFDKMMQNEDVVAFCNSTSLRKDGSQARYATTQEQIDEYDVCIWNPRAIRDYSRNHDMSKHHVIKVDAPEYILIARAKARDGVNSNTIQRIKSEANEFDGFMGDIIIDSNKLTPKKAAQLIMTLI